MTSHLGCTGEAPQGQTLLSRVLTLGILDLIGKKKTLPSPDLQAVTSQLNPL